MKLIFALGNPGDQYARTRHNAGFQVVEKFASDHGANWSTETKFKSTITTVIIAREKLLLAKPTTYYNEVGDTFHRIQAYFGIDSSSILIIHDELALPFGTIRTRAGGSDGGNKGIRSLMVHPEAAEAMRIRIGIANELSGQIDASDFVLSKFTKVESESLDAVYSYCTEAIQNFAENGLEPTTYQV